MEELIERARQLLGWPTTQKLVQLAHRFPDEESWQRAVEKLGQADHPNEAYLIKCLETARVQPKSLAFIEIWLKCPRCKKVTKVFWRGFTDFPYVRCTHCGELSASGAYSVSYFCSGLERRRQSYPCHFCGEMDCEKDHLEIVEEEVK